MTPACSPPVNRARVLAARARWDRRWRCILSFQGSLLASLVAGLLCAGSREAWLLWSAVLLHEMGHWVASRPWRSRICFLGTPLLGLTLNLDPEADPKSELRQLVILLSGPGANVAVSILAWIPAAISPGDRALWIDFSLLNALIGLGNLLPFLPCLDGGQMLLSILRQRSGPGWTFAILVTWTVVGLSALAHLLPLPLVAFMALLSAVHGAAHWLGRKLECRGEKPAPLTLRAGLCIFASMLLLITAAFVLTVRAEAEEQCDPASLGCCGGDATFPFTDPDSEVEEECCDCLDWESSPPLLEAPPPPDSNRWNVLHSACMSPSEAPIRPAWDSGETMNEGLPVVECSLRPKIRDPTFLPDSDGVESSVPCPECRSASHPCRLGEIGMTMGGIMNPETLSAEAGPIHGFEVHSLGHDLKVWTGRVARELLALPGLLPGLWRLRPEERPLIFVQGKWVLAPRYQRAFGRDYAFSRQVARATDMAPELVPFLDWVRSFVEPRANGALLNFYESEDHYIGAHRDSRKGLIPGSRIATLSLGGERVFRIRPWKGKAVSHLAERQGIDIPILHGDAVVIPWDANLAFTHQVLRRAAGAPRISLTFRAFED